MRLLAALVFAIVCVLTCAAAQAQQITVAGGTFPATLIGAVVVIVNLPRVRDGELKLTGEALADIYAGKIRKWNDPALAALNPDITLPNVSIAPVHRYDASGTSFRAPWRRSV